MKYEFDRNSDPFVRQYIIDHSNWDKNTLDGDNPDAWMILKLLHLELFPKCTKPVESISVEVENCQ